MIFLFTAGSLRFTGYILHWRKRKMPPMLAYLPISVIWAPVIGPMKIYVPHIKRDSTEKTEESKVAHSFVVKTWLGRMNLVWLSVFMQNFCILKLLHNHGITGVLLPFLSLLHHLKEKLDIALHLRKDFDSDSSLEKVPSWPLELMLESQANEWVISYALAWG